MATNTKDAEAEPVVSRPEQLQKVESDVTDASGETGAAITSDQEYLEALERKAKLAIRTLKSAPLEVFKFFGSKSTLDALIDGHMFEIRVDFIKFLVHRPDLLNAVEKYRWRSTALLVASYYGNTKAVQSLLGYGADVFILNWKRNNCLHLAARRGHLEVVREILKSSEKEPAANIGDKQSSRQTTATLQQSQGNGKEATLQPRARIVNLARKIGDQETALMLAAENGHTAVAKLLMEHKADVFQKNCYGWTCLHYSLFYRDQTAVMEEILKANAEVVNARDDFGKTALMHASAKGREGEQFVKLLLQHKADASIVDINGWTCLHHAANKGTCAILSGILQHCPGILNVTTTRMFTALMIASRLGRLDRVTVLLEQKPDVLTTDSDGWNCLHFAVSLSFMLVVKKILQYCSELVNTATTSGLTPLIIASQNEDVNIVKVLLEHKAHPRMTSKDGWNCFHHAAYNGRVLILKEILRSDPDIASTETTSDFTALKFASECGHDDIVKLLSEHVGAVQLAE